jgi:hypothetical protein
VLLSCEQRLTRCDPIPEPVWAYAFPSSAALIAFVLDFGTDCPVENDTMLIPDHRKANADATLQQLNLTSWVQTFEMFAVEVWGEEGEAALDAAFG